MYSPDGMNIVGSDDSGAVCIWGQNKNVIRLYIIIFMNETILIYLIIFIYSRHIRCHEEAVHTVAYSPDSSILLTACTLGNIRLHCIDMENQNFSVINGKINCIVFLKNVF